jgi:hypothetical protein
MNKSNWFGFWIRVAYWLHLRKWVNDVQRRFKEKDAKRSKLPTFSTPWAVPDYVTKNKYKWREDSTRLGGWVIPLDWISHEEVFQARLDSDSFPEGIGDCDDRHSWAAHCYALIPAVSRVYRVSVGYEGRGHTVCVFKMNDQWYLDNYGLKEISDPNEVPGIIAAWGTKKGGLVKPTWYVFENLDFTAEAVGLKGRVDL